MIKVFISGKVQGVFFRESTKKKVLELGVVGWVRNLDEMLNWAKKGLPLAKALRLVRLF